MASRASVGSIDTALSATAYALAQDPNDKHAIAVKVNSGRQPKHPAAGGPTRSEERRVGKECPV